MAEYSQEDLLGLSGIQHFLFCRRQWALIYVEQQWQENLYTVEGKLMHDRADDPYFTEVREGTIIARAMPVASYRLGFNGICDVVEFTPVSEGVALPGRKGFYRPIPVEYKRGSEKEEAWDRAQLCAQAICLEEMLAIDIPAGYLYYGKTRHRTQVQFDLQLRNLVEKISMEMHTYFSRGYTPQVKTSKMCKSCSLFDLCMVTMQSERVNVRDYIFKHVNE